MKEIQIHYSKWVLWLKVILFLSLAIGGSYICIYSLSRTTDFRAHIFLFILALAALLLFFFAFTNIKRLVSKDPALIIDEAGIYLHSSNRISGFIAWENIENFQVEDNGIGKKWIYPIVRNPMDYTEQLNPISRFSAYLLKVFRRSPIVIEVSPLDIKMEELTSILIRYKENSQREAQA